MMKAEPKSNHEGYEARKTGTMQAKCYMKIILLPLAETQLFLPSLL